VALENGLLIADVVHQRVSPKPHRLSYRVYYLCFPLARMGDIVCRFLGVNKGNLLSFHECDHGFAGRPCKDWVAEVLQEYAVGTADGDVVLLTMPRVLGYVFNPVSFWFCLDSAGILRAVVAEVNNTFGERHAYLCVHDDQRAITRDDWLETKKVFHVSPFLRVRGEYRFRFAYSADQIGVWIDYADEGQVVLHTAMTGRRRRLDSSSVARCFFRYPLLTLKIIGLIHWHALRMVVKGFRYYRKPVPPNEEISR
jgi:DUF1365 family protein